MQPVVVDKPYVPIAPHPSAFWQGMLRLFLPRMLRKGYGIVDVKAEQLDRLKDSIRQGHGIILAPNHCRDEDPLVVGMLTRLAPTPLFIMASWHLFMMDRFKRFLLPRAGAFSIYREGIDRTAINTAVDILESAKRPLILFPEGHISRTNDHLNELMDGVTLIARTAAKRRAKTNPPGKVVIHPVAIRYQFLGDCNAAIENVLSEIETRLTWRPQRELTHEQRIYKLGEALLILKEVEYLGTCKSGDLGVRVQNLIDAILGPLEDEWADHAHDGSVNARVKRLRTAILPDMVQNSIDATERQRRWKHLADCYLAMQLYHYPPEYVRSSPTPSRMLETVERFEEDLTDKVRVHGPRSATLTIGEAIEVPAGRESRGDGDPILGQIASQLQQMLGLTR